MIAKVGVTAAVAALVGVGGMAFAAQLGADAKAKTKAQSDDASDATSDDSTVSLDGAVTISLGG